MNKIDLLQYLTNQAKKYRLGANESLARNAHMHHHPAGVEIEQRTVDAILTDFINTIGMKQGVDYALYAIDLNENCSPEK